MKVEQIIEADLTWHAGRFEKRLQVAVNAGGRIEGVGCDLGKPTLRLGRTALLPGFVNAHSHAFQRGLRGRGEHFPSGTGTFWTWREAMYALVEGLDVDTCYNLSAQAFREMRSAGITTVGEFHYVHHAQHGDFLLDECVRQAALDSGIRLVLLQAYYRHGGIGEPLGRQQARFDGLSLDDYWRQYDRLRGRLDPLRESLGVVAHSIRAVGLEDISALYAGARRLAVPFHIHVEEQQQEIQQSLERYGCTPMRALLDEAQIGPGATAVHCTHSQEADLAEWIERGGTVCLCPLTEANLADGVPSLNMPLRLPLPFSLGSDSNARISIIEEMRWAEYAQRLAEQRRGVIRDPAGACAELLLECATRAGAEALGISAGSIQSGTWADFVSVDLEHPSLEGCTDETLAATIVFGASEGIVRDTAVGGRWRKEAVFKS